MSNTGAFALATALLVLLAIANANAQEAVSEDSENLEEVTVVAPRTPTMMRADIVRAEEYVLGIYNALNDDDDYDIRCDTETPLGSHIPERVCRPVYSMRIEAQAAREFLQFGTMTPTGGEIAYHHSILKEKLAELSSANPSLVQALQRYYDVSAAYDEAREERFGSD
jgi:hypothetical protein